MTRLYLDCWAVGNFDLMPEILHPEIVWTAIESAPDAGTRRGYAECRNYMEDWFDGFSIEATSSELLETSSDGRLVFSLYHRAEAKLSGVTTDIRYAGVFRFAEDARIFSLHEYATAEEALGVVGSREQPSAL